MDMSSVIKKSDWADLPVEQLRDVIKRLEKKESESTHKHVVACAGVCKTWRVMCKEIVKTPEFSSKLTFPVSFKQPGPKDGIIQCFIKRDKSNMTYRLYLSLSPGSLVESGKFLLSAKRTRRIPYKEYLISTDADNISRSSTNYIGKLRSNMLGTKFEIYDDAYNGCHKLSPPKPSRSRWFNYSTKKVSPNASPGTYNIAQVTYCLNLFKPHGPRRIHCIINSIPSSALEEPDLKDEKEGKEREGPLALRNKPPRWHEQLKCWCLNFRGRVRVASVKNFQLMEDIDATSTLAQKKEGVESNQNKIIMQFGKVDKDMFTMDYRYPLSAFQAFAICLTSFDTKLACE